MKYTERDEPTRLEGWTVGWLDQEEWPWMDPSYLTTKPPSVLLLVLLLLLLLHNLIIIIIQCNSLTLSILSRRGMNDVAWSGCELYWDGLGCTEDSEAFREFQDPNSQKNVYILQKTA